MTGTAVDMEGVIDLVRQAHRRLDGTASFRLQTLFDMVLLELEHERARHGKQGTGDGARGSES